MQHLCGWLFVKCESADPSSIFHLPALFNLTLNRPNSPQLTASANRTPKPVAAMAISSSSASNFVESRFSPSYSSSSASSIDSIPESREPTPEYDPIAAHEALAPLHWDVEEFDFGVISEGDEPQMEGEDLQSLFQGEMEESDNDRFSWDGVDSSSDSDSAARKAFFFLGSSEEGSEEDDGGGSGYDSGDDNSGGSSTDISAATAADSYSGSTPTRSPKRRRYLLVVDIGVVS